MNTRVNPLIASVMAVSLLTSATARAEVRSLTLGINVNCPPGLGECWNVGIGEGVAKSPVIASIYEVADGITQTAIVRSKEGRLVHLESLSQHIVDIQLGARLRSTEAVVDGWLERRDGDVVLKISRTGETVLLQPLTRKTQWDRKKNSEFPATEAEQKAYENLLTNWPGGRQPVRIVGPLRDVKHGAEMALEVREAFLFNEGAPPFGSLDIGIKVSSPYGLGEPWSEARTALLESQDIASVADQPDSVHSVTKVQPKTGRVPDLKDLATRLGRIGIGAEITGVEASLEGTLVMQNGQMILKPDGSSQTLPLAPLTHKIQWDLRQQRISEPVSREREAYQTLAGQVSGTSARVRVTGPLIESEDRAWTLLEVRTFLLNPPSPAVMASGKFRDTVPPAVLGNPRAIVRAKGSVFLDWDGSTEEDVAGYNIYRSTRPDGRFTKVNRKLLAATELALAASSSSKKYLYSVTAVDGAGNESARSAPVDARPPSSPRHLFGRGTDNALLLEWDPSEAQDLDSYIVHRSEKPGGPYAAISVGVLSCNYTDHGAVNGRTYHYIVTAVDSSSNESVHSNEITMTPAGRPPQVAVSR
jgi:hypothetical protein